MEILNNIDRLLGNDLKVNISWKPKVSIAASYFSIYAYEILKKELDNIYELGFIFRSPTFILDSRRREKREFYIQK